MSGAKTDGDMAREDTARAELARDDLARPDARAGVPFGRYTLIERLAKGGMGEVHLAMAQGPHGVSKPCVIKLLLDEFSGDREQVQRFIEEARILVSLSHRNIVQMLEFGRVKDEYFIAMEYIEGLSLGQLLAARAPLPPEIALFITREVLAGLAHAHSLEQDGTSSAIIHRDISPSNVLLSLAGDVKLVDFGLARRPMSPQLTGHGVVVGKLPYFAPELVRREPHTPQSDLYAMGVCLFEMVTGEPYVDLRERDLFQAIDLLRGKRFVPPSSVRPGLPEALDQICSRALAPEAQDRYAKATHMRRDAQAALAALAPVTDGEALARLMAKEAHPRRRFSYAAAPPSTSSDALEPDTVSLAMAVDARWLAAERRGGAVAELRLPGMRPFGLLTGSPPEAAPEPTQELELPDDAEVAPDEVAPDEVAPDEVLELPADPTLLSARPVMPESTDRRTAPPVETPPPGRPAGWVSRPVTTETPAPTEADTLLFGPGAPGPTPTPASTPPPQSVQQSVPLDRRETLNLPGRGSPQAQPGAAGAATPEPDPDRVADPASSLHTEDTARLVAPGRRGPVTLSLVVELLGEVRRQHLVYAGAGLGLLVLALLIRFLVR